MLTTTGIAETGNVPKTLSPGEQQVTVNRLYLTDGYEPGSYKLLADVEGPDMGDDFEGFLIDKDNAAGPRYKGQVGRVRLHPYDFIDGKTKTGYPVSRDKGILTHISKLASALGERDAVDQIQENTIEALVERANKILCPSSPLNIVLGSKQYVDKAGYTKHDLYVPMSKTGQVGYESMHTLPEKSKLITFDPAVHIIQPKEAAKVENFEGSATPAENAFSKATQKSVFEPGFSKDTDQEDILF